MPLIPLGVYVSSDLGLLRIIGIHCNVRTRSIRWVSHSYRYGTSYCDTHANRYSIIYGDSGRSFDHLRTNINFHINAHAISATNCHFPSCDRYINTDSFANTHLDTFADTGVTNTDRYHRSNTIFPDCLTITVACSCYSNTHSLADSNGDPTNCNCHSNSDTDSNTSHLDSIHRLLG